MSDDENICISKSRLFLLFWTVGLFIASAIVVSTYGDIAIFPIFVGFIFGMMPFFVFSGQDDETPPWEESAE